LDDLLRSQHHFARHPPIQRRGTSERLWQLIARAHDHQIKVIGVTELPCEGTSFYSAEIEAKRQTLNQWIRTGKAMIP
jgi:hypothetical protein